ncbi:MAG: tRNA glutamyl-Q(34) synthetase GluQRS, partial [Myxococcales bacterium]|nr:tRNA glutamyl-Q(34) synthetase GluQRS [Myxococcales bacterium]
FAPTPTGRLHLGNARTALLSWLAAAATGRRNVLRVEDLDPAAMPEGCMAEQLADLAWLGLTWDEGPAEGGPVGPYRQSERSALYAEALQALNALGVLYPCWCSRREVREASRAPHASDEGPVYAGTCRPSAPTVWPDLTALPRRRGRVPALRLDVAAALARLGVAGPFRFDDLAAGPQAVELAAAMGDFVVRRTDGIAAYQVACSIDDAYMGCDLVVRGADLLASAARQLLILRLLGLPEPAYAHVGLVLAPDGTRLAKRDGAIALATLREAGEDPGAVRARLAASAGLPATGDLAALVAAFRVEGLSADSVRLPA